MKHDYSGKVMAMKVINKKEVIDKEYVNHTILEKEIMAMVFSFISKKQNHKTYSNVYLIKNRCGPIHS